MTSAHGIRIDTPSKGAGSAITTVYGLKIENQTGGGTNYAIYTGTGAVRLGGGVDILGDCSVAGITSLLGDLFLNGNDIDLGGGLIHCNVTTGGLHFNGMGGLLNYYDDSTFTVTLTNISGTTTGTARYTRVGSVVSVSIPVISGASNGSLASLSGFPVALRPAREIEVTCVLGSAISGSYLRYPGYAVWNTVTNQFDLYYAPSNPPSFTSLALGGSGVVGTGGDAGFVITYTLQ
jgi:hypothetical protein